MCKRRNSDVMIKGKQLLLNIPFKVGGFVTKIVMFLGKVIWYLATLGKIHTTASIKADNVMLFIYCVLAGGIQELALGGT